MLVGDCAEEKPGHRDHPHEDLERNESPFRARTGERPQAVVRSPDRDGVRRRRHRRRGGRTEAKSSPDQKREHEVLEGERRGAIAEGE